VSPLVWDDGTETTFLEVQGIKDGLLNLASQVVVASVADHARFQNVLGVP
jgi:hypothetical protein